MRRPLNPQYRRKSRFPYLLLLLLGLLVAALAWFASRDTEVPTQRIEQDVTNAALAS